MKKQRGSLTIEAALVMPLVLAVFLLAMNAGIHLYEECREMAAAAMDREEIDAAAMFYRQERVKRIAEYGSSVY